MKGPVVLLGPSGAGKSTAGAQVAVALGMRFVDLDDHVGDLPTIFKDEGEAFLVQSSVLEAIGKIGPAAKAAISVIRKIAVNPDINLGIQVIAEKTLKLIEK